MQSLRTKLSLDKARKAGIQAELEALSSDLEAAMKPYIWLQPGLIPNNDAIEPTDEQFNAYCDASAAIRSGSVTKSRKAVSAALELL